MTTLDKILLTCAIFMLLFTVCMIVLFCIFQSVPDALIDSVFGLFSCEAFMTMLIWAIKRHGVTKSKQKKEGTDNEK